MQKIHFTPRDLARVRVAATLGPRVETVFALHLLAQSPIRTPTFAAWRRRVDACLGQRARWVRPLVESFPSHRRLLDLLDQPSEADEAVLARMGLDQPWLVRLMRDLTEVAVLPYWDRMLRRLEAERDVRGRMAINGGVEFLLSRLHPRVRWAPHMLEVAGEPAEIRLRGHGLLLAPSFFLFDRATTLARSNRTNEQLVLAYSITPDRTEAKELWESPSVGNGALAALVGRTRAEALQALADTCTTGKLAERLGISSAGASQHTAVLRDAGLIMSHRNRNTVLHTLTSLGAALLTGKGP